MTRPESDSRITETHSEVETQTGFETAQPVDDNSPIKRSDGSYRPLDTDLVERLRQGVIDSYRRNPDSHKHQAEFWKEFGDNCLGETPDLGETLEMIPVSAPGGVVGA